MCQDANDGGNNDQFRSNLPPIFFRYKLIFCVRLHFFMCSVRAFVYALVHMTTAAVFGLRSSYWRALNLRFFSVSYEATDTDSKGNTCEIVFRKTPGNKCTVSLFLGYVFGHAAQVPVSIYILFLLGAICVFFPRCAGGL